MKDDQNTGPFHPHVGDLDETPGLSLAVLAVGTIRGVNQQTEEQ